MIENVYIYHEKKNDKNVNMRQKAKPIILKAILKQSNLKTIKEDQEKANVNLRRGSNSYQYNVINDFGWTLTNMFFGDLMKIRSYKEFMQQYLAAMERKEQKNVKAT